MSKTIKKPSKMSKRGQTSNRVHCSYSKNLVNSTIVEDHQETIVDFKGFQDKLEKNERKEKEMSASASASASASTPLSGTALASES